MVSGNTVPVQQADEIDEFVWTVFSGIDDSPKRVMNSLSHRVQKAVVGICLHHIRGTLEYVQFANGRIVRYDGDAESFAALCALVYDLRT
jgi:hypothetical protein